ncbi:MULTISPECIES: Fe-S cluster assembly protein SufD [unclassified Alistipes]|uniref:Fe-S cluster assembly protein SufD n=1 Tax=unclassified Alistipes TaxID=2608932 RepID=UPI000E4F5E9C|nr:Fe-S cluster assembly protein SufD [Alistipes sp. AF48-12]RHO70474.1 Fe-S cluster assembly protein SufD [Alistipes sp. AF48-12]
MESSLEKQLVELYLAGADIIGEGLPVPLNRPRAGALETFNLLGIPPRGSGYGDRYHYTDLRNLFQQEYERYFTPSYPSAALAMPETEGERLSLLNGFCTSEQPLTRSENGVIFGSLAAAAKAYPELVERYYNQLAESQGDAVSALNTVFAQDGAFVYVPQGVRAERPFVISFSYYSEGESLAGFARNLFVFESGSRAQVVIENRSASDETYFDCQVREVFAAEDARADIVELFRLNGRSSIVSGSFTEQQASSRVHTLSVGLEGRLIRGDQHVALKGRGAENHTDGLMLSGAGQHIDFTTDIRHISRDCTSYEVFKGIASDGGTGVFSGRIYVAQDAQKTQAYQQSNNLLLGDRAHIYAKPQLEIYADDVKCSHGATVGQLSEEAVYYMRQRGIPEQTARRLQMAGFINQVVERTPVEGLTERIERLAADKIERM